MKVKLQRIKKGITQKQLCEILHISSNKMVQIERGDYKNLTYPLMIKIAEALESSVIKLFFEEGF